MKRFFYVLLTILLISTGCNSPRENNQTDSTNQQEKIQKEDENKKQDKTTIQEEEFVESLPIIGTKNRNYQLFAWSDFGMNYMDSDYSVFSISPPNINLSAQLIKKGAQLSTPITSDINISYQAVASFIGKYNTSSANKINFWEYSFKLFNKDIQKDQGLQGALVQKTATLSKMEYDINKSSWRIEGIPTVPIENKNTINQYPMVRVLAKDAQGETLAETITVLPISTFECKICHQSNENYTQAKPFKGYVYENDSEKDYRYNILRLHDQQHDITPYLDTLKSRGYNYKASLEETARDGTPILCAICHQSSTLKIKGLEEIKPLTLAIHSNHANAIDPTTAKTLNNSVSRKACYICHAGYDKEWFRGAMGKIKNNNKFQIECQNCHGTLSALGNSSRDIKLDLPTCQSCHQNGNRFISAVLDIKTGTLRNSTDDRFATNENLPYRFSKGHGNLQCSVCHGSTHAIYSSLKNEDNFQSKTIQKESGTIYDCTACHLYMPKTIDGGPHGMHTLGVAWVDDEHQVAVINQGSESCKTCHGEDYNGTVLSKMFSDQRFGGKSFKKGDKIGCYDCHNGPTGIGY